MENIESHYEIMERLGWKVFRHKDLVARLIQEKEEGDRLYPQKPAPMDEPIDYLPTEGM